MHRLQEGSKVVGTKQTRKALQRRQVQELFVAEDAEDEQINPLIQMARKEDIPVVFFATMKELGLACQVEVKTATAALILD